MEIAATRALDRDSGKDPLSPVVVDDVLVVHRFALPADQQGRAVLPTDPQEQQQQVTTAAVAVPIEQQFTILLNKFNTVRDHVRHAHF